MNPLRTADDASAQNQTWCQYRRSTSKGPSKSSNTCQNRVSNCRGNERITNNENQLNSKNNTEQALRSHAGSQLTTTHINMQQATCNTTTHASRTTRNLGVLI